MTASSRLAPSTWVLRLLWFPFRVLWRAATGLVNMLGILLGLLVGGALMAIGWVLCSTVITGIVGLPMMFVGAVIVLRALY